MKKAAPLLGIIAFLFSSSFAGAGGFFGPPPFTNGSPLPTGVEGTYQATARGKHVTGLIRFAYASGGNPSLTGNEYILFINGVMVSGTVQAAIMDNRISGVLNTPTATGSNPTVAAFSVGGGYFNAKMNTSSPFADFSGKGQVSVFTLPFASFPDPPAPPVSSNKYQQNNFNFKVQGMRTSQNG